MGCQAMSDPLTQLSALLARLPGIGEKSALRLALAIARESKAYAGALSAAISNVSTGMHECPVCCDLTDAEECAVCLDARRDQTTICVVAQPQDRMAFERSGVFQGRYHVLHGLVDPLAGVGPKQLRMRQLLDRLRDSAVTEVIVATSPTVEGDATAMLISGLLDGVDVAVSRISSGVAVGGELEHADMTTLTRALADRRPLR